MSSTPLTSRAGRPRSDAASTSRDLQFDAFISYSHTADGKLGPSLRDGIHNFNRPWLRPRQMRVFCDTRSLSSSPDLWHSIAGALDNSRHLILLASPESARSPWVRREVVHWVSAGRKPPLIVLTNGTITWDNNTHDFDWTHTSALPEELRGVFPAEPAWIDIRSMSVGAGQAGSSRDPVFVDAVASIASVLQNRPKDELIGEDIKNYRNALRFRQLMWSALSLLTVLALVAAGLAIVQRNEAQNQRDRAIANQVTTQVGRLEGSDLSLAAQLALVATRMHPTDDLYSELVSLSALPLATRYDSPAISSTYSPKAGLMATQAPNGQVSLWRSTAQAELQRVGSVAAEIGHVALSSDGRLLAVSGKGGVLLWDLADPAHPVHRGPRLAVDQVDVLTFAPNARILAAGSEDQTVHLWDVTALESPNQMGPPLSGHGQAVVSLAFAPDGRTLASGSVDHTVRMWNLANPWAPAPLGPPQDFQVFVTALAFTPDGRTLAIGLANGPVYLRDVSNVAAPRPIGEPLNAHQNTVMSIAFSPDGAMMATGSTDRTIRLWNVLDAANAEPFGPPLLGSAAGVWTVDFGADGRSVIVAAEDALRVWQVPTAQRLLPDGAETVITAADGVRVTATGVDGTIRIWGADLPGGVMLPPSIQTRSSPGLGAAASSADGRLLTRVNASGPALLWILPLPGQPNVIPPARVLEGGDNGLAVAMSRDGRLVASAGTGPDVRLWNLDDPANPIALGRAPLGNVGGFVRAVALSPDSRTLAVGGADGHLKFWNVADPAHPAPMPEPAVSHDNGILSISYSPDGHTLATAGDMVVRLWDVSDPAAPKPLGAPLGGFNTPPYVVRFSPTHPVLAVGNGEGIALWNVADPSRASRIGGTLVGQTGQIRSLAFNADGSQLFSGGTDRTVRRWVLDPERTKAEICARTRGVLTPETWAEYVSADLPFDPPCAPD